MRALRTQAGRDRLAAVVLVVGGLGLGAGGAWFAATNRAFLARAERTPGTVVAIAKRRGAKGMPLHFPIVRHRPAGRSEALEFEARPGLWPCPFAVGDPVVVAYDPANPTDAKIVSVWTLWFLPGAMGALGVLCLVAGRSTWKNAAR